MGGRQDESEQLFLLEALVDYLTISNSRLNLDKNVLSNLTDTCVLFQFLNYPPLVVCESDFIGTSQNHIDTSQVNFKSGKSCFFSLRAPKGPILPVPFDVKVSVIRKLREGVLPNKLDIGKTLISMGIEFTELLRQSTDKEYDAMPLSRNKNGMFEITDASGKGVGSLAAFIRLSCFGKLIVTQFSLNKENDKSYLFKGADVSSLLGDQNQKPVIKEDNKPTVQFPSSINKSNINDNDRAKRGQLSQECSSTKDFKKHDMRKDRKYEDSDDYFKSTKLPRCDDCNNFKKDYARLYANECGCPQFETRPCCCPEISSSFLHSYKPRKSSITESKGKGVLCDCPYPVDRNLLSKYTKRQERRIDLAPGEVGLQDDQVIFQLPLKRTGDAQTERDKIKDSAVSYKLTSQEESKCGKQKNTVQIKSDDASGDKNKSTVCPVSGLPKDDNHDVFLLKIGKKMDGDKKRNLELELRTPRMKEPKPRTVDQNCQYQEDEIPFFEGKEKGNAGPKKGKGKKK